MRARISLNQRYVSKELRMKNPEEHGRRNFLRTLGVGAMGASGRDDQREGMEGMVGAAR